MVQYLQSTIIVPDEGVAGQPSLAVSLLRFEMTKLIQPGCEHVTSSQEVVIPGIAAVRHVSSVVMQFADKMRMRVCQIHQQLLVQERPPGVFRYAAATSQSTMQLV